jgi:hypothetical protein
MSPLWLSAALVAWIFVGMAWGELGWRVKVEQRNEVSPCE